MEETAARVQQQTELEQQEQKRVLLQQAPDISAAAHAQQMQQQAAAAAESGNVGSTAGQAQQQQQEPEFAAAMTFLHQQGRLLEGWQRSWCPLKQRLFYTHTLSQWYPPVISHRRCCQPPKKSMSMQQTWKQ